MTSAIADMQKSIKIKSDDLREELTELQQWESEIKRRNLHAVKVSPELAPIRGTNPSSSPTPAAAARTKAARAETAKEQGNEYFRRGEYKEAIRLYTKGIDVDPCGPIAHLMYANRAMCYLKEDNLADAESDASNCIDLKRTYHKAYYRRALARRGLKKFADARKDLETVLALVPNDPDTTKELRAVTLLMRQEEQAKANANAPTRRKMVIEEVDEDDEDEENEKSDHVKTEQVKPATTNKPHVANGENVPVSASTKSPVEPPKKTSTAPAPKSVKTNPRVEELDDDDCSTSTATHAPVPEKPKAKPTASENGRVTASSVQVTTSVDKAPVVHKDPVVSSGMTGHTVVAITKENLKMPRTFSEFERYHTDIREDNDLFDYYISLISPRDFPSLFGAAMTPEMLTDICQYVTRNSPSVAYAVLSGLTEVRRIDDLLMFLSDDEAKVIEAAIEHAKTTNNNMERILSKFE
eukprot:Tbor_TRINITY_DN2715_c0_g1::TRINITY_DN2715_c0_g1_i1::g.15220::m.15220